MKKIFSRAILVSLLWIIFSVKDVELTGVSAALVNLLFLTLGIVYIWCAEIKREPK